MSDNHARVWFSLFVLAVFCLGGGAGILVGRHLTPGPGGMLAMHGLGPEGPPAVPPPEVIRAVEDQLQMDPAQRAQVERIVDEHRGRLEQVHREAQQRFAEEARGLHAEIRALLRPDQQERFDRFLQQQHIR